jgi:hypothetical protein
MDWDLSRAILLKGYAGITGLAEKDGKIWRKSGMNANC